ncbi:MAG: potassium-transporting ATPase subunit C [Candidatus Eremiobacterota bacterium]
MSAGCREGAQGIAGAPRSRAPGAQPRATARPSATALPRSSDSFWGRLSATGPTPYNGAASCGSNYGPTSRKMVEAATARANALREADPASRARIPMELLTASGSGLDPHITLAGALYQVPRVARSRGLQPTEVEGLVRQHGEAGVLGGEPRVNVVKLNRAVDRYSRAGGVGP